VIDSYPFLIPPFTHEGRGGSRFAGDGVGHKQAGPFKIKKIFPSVDSIIISRQDVFVTLALTQNIFSVHVRSMNPDAMVIAL
jgi:hypothetical protein